MHEWQDLARRQPRFEANRRFYDSIRVAQGQYRLLDKFTIPPYESRAFLVPKGHVFRVIEEAGPQVGSVAFWNSDNFQETFLAASTWGHEGVFVKVYSRMLSTLPWFRPLLTCINDTVAMGGGNHHHVIGTHCSPETIEFQYRRSAQNACRRSLLQAIELFGLEESDLHDSINVHQKVDLSDGNRGRIHTLPSDAKKGDYIEFYAEVNLLVAVAVCPFGDGTRDPTTREEAGVQPLGIEVFDTGVTPLPSPKWSDWRQGWKGRWTMPNR